MVTTQMRRPPLRLTRRGRAVALGFFILLSCLASAILLASASQAESRPAGPAPATPAVLITVQPYDTLWSIATRGAPHRDPYAAIAEIQKINDLDGYVVHPGQSLELPR